MMNAIKTIYNDLPKTIKIPKDFIHKKGEIIIILDDNIKKDKKNKISSFFGAIPDFSKRFSQGSYEEREALWSYYCFFGSV